MKGLWLRLGEAATGRPADPGGPRPARPALPPVFGTEPVVAFERELGDDAGTAEQGELVDPPARPAPDPDTTPGPPRTEAAPWAPAEGRAGASSQPGPSRGGEDLQPLGGRRHATAAQPPAAGPGRRADSAGFRHDREVGRSHPRAEGTSRGETAQERLSPSRPRPATGPGPHLSLPLMPRPGSRDPDTAAIARVAAARAVRPLQAHAQPAARAPGEGTPASLPAATEPATPTVEIRIGRIEVRAVRAPSRPPHNEPRPTAPQVSLEEYLRARTAGR
jgi:hypothetical protein